VDEATLQSESTTDTPPPTETGDPSTASDQPIPAAGTDGDAGPNPVRDAVLDALHNVLDPELGINIVDLGLVYEVEVRGDTVHIEYTLTTMGCPIGPLIEAEIRQLLAGIEGVGEVDAEMVLRPPWTPEMMSEEAKAALGFF
jgi:metal-sulfur cluster biosynthetic enzyme